MKQLFAAAVAVLAALPPSASHAAPADNAVGHQSASIDQIEAKWRPALEKVRGWTPDAFRQFREGYAAYPAAVLESALAALSFEEAQATLDAHAAVRSRDAMAKAMRKSYPVGLTLATDAQDDQVAEAKRLAAKALGDDARDLVFIPITPCTVWDTRFATNPDSMGIINNAQTKRFYSHLDGAGGSYAAYGGNPSCPETAQNSIGPRPFAVMMTVYVNDASANGWLTLYRDGDPDPSLATISMYYSPGPTRTQTVIAKSSRGYGTGTYDISATSRYGNANASASVTGYFVKVQNPPVSIMSGRLTNNGGQLLCTVGAPTGLSNSAACDTSAVATVATLIPQDVVARNFRVVLDSPATSTTNAYLIDTGIFEYLSCTVPIGQATCLAPGPALIPAGTRIATEVAPLSGGVVPAMSFGFELVKP